MQQRITILFIAMEFPPVNTTGNFRSLKFVKYLSQFGIDPIVVTLKEEQAAKYFSSKIDYNLLTEIPEKTPVYRIDCFDEDVPLSKFQTFSKMFFRINDSLARRWKPGLLQEIRAIIETHKPQLIYVSLPPFSTGMLAVDISRKYQLPLIVDMRDLWSMWGSTPYMTIIHYLLTRTEESKVFRYASAIIGVTPQLIEIFRASHPSLAPRQFYLIPNGFDTDIALLKDFEFLAGKKKVVIGYVGSFYYHPATRNNRNKPWWRRGGHKMLQYSPIKEDWLYRSPYFFFRTISTFFERYPEYRSVIEIHFVGHTPAWLSSMANQFGIYDQIVSHGFVNSVEAARIQDTFDLILATSEKVFDSDHYCLPSKIFDYVGRSKPILGFVTNGIQKEFITKSGLGVICDPDNEEQALTVLHDLLVDGKVFSVQKEYLSFFHRKKITEQLALLLKEVVIFRN